jgi:hypothetical protein
MFDVICIAHRSSPECKALDWLPSIEQETIIAGERESEREREGKGEGVGVVEGEGGKFVSLRVSVNIRIQHDTIHTHTYTHIMNIICGLNTTAEKKIRYTCMYLYSV